MRDWRDLPASYIIVRAVVVPVALIKVAAFLFLLRHPELIQFPNPQYTYTLLLGEVLFDVYVLWSTAAPSDTMCRVQAGMLAAASTLVCISIALKTRGAFMLYNQPSKAHHYTTSGSRAVGVVLACVGFVLALVAIWFAADAPHVGEDGASRSWLDLKDQPLRCVLGDDTGTGFALALLVLHVLILVYAAVYAQRTRNLPPPYGEAMEVLAVCLVVTTVLLVAVPARFIQKGTDAIAEFVVETEAALVIGNSAFILLILPRLTNHRKLELAELRLTMQPPGCRVPLPVEMRPPLSFGGSHCFLSHVWVTGQDQVATIKAMMANMVPALQIWLDLDDLTKSGRRAPRTLSSLCTSLWCG